MFLIVLLLLLLEGVELDPYKNGRKWPTVIIVVNRSARNGRELSI